MEKTFQKQDGNATQVTPLPTMQQVQYAIPPELNGLMRQEEKPDKRPFECTLCGNRFRQQCHLTQHIRIHTNDRPYQCSHCEKAFKQKSQLNQHERIHTGEKPYQCPLCEKAFPQAGQLYSHKKTHGINPNVNKRPSYSIEDDPSIPKRGRKRKSKSTPVMSPPPFTYLIESLHRQPYPQTSHSESSRPEVKDKLPSSSTLLAPNGFNIRPQYLIPLPKVVSPPYDVRPSSSRAQYYISNHINQHYVHYQQHPQHVNQLPSPSHSPQYNVVNQQEQHSSPALPVKQESISPPQQQAHMPTGVRKQKPQSPLLSEQARNVTAAVSTELTNSSVGGKLNSSVIPSHLKDLERLIPSCDS